MSAPFIIRELPVPGGVLRRLAARDPDRYPVLMDSAAEGPLSRSSILAAEPRAALWLDPAGNVHTEGVKLPDTGFLDALEQWWLTERVPGPVDPDAPVFAGGWTVFFGYELAREIEPRLVLPASSLPWQAFALRTPCAVVHDLASGRVFAVAEADSAHLLDRIAADASEAARGLLADAASNPGDVPASLAAPVVPRRVPVASIEEEDPRAHIERVIRAKEYVRAGDIYQANLSRPWHITLAEDVSAAQLFEVLCRSNPAPFAALAQWRGASIVSSSPERLARISADRLIETRPIAGTRPRSWKPGGDLAEMTELAGHPKERAEHVMLIDLERNDLGRVCEAGTVRVDEFMTIESYAHVHHIVSNVSGRLRPDVTPMGAIRAVFPGGTITGCPKVRCMEIIAELEGMGRGAYTGSLGFINRDGRMDTNILIRTMTLAGRRVELRAGGGIVADSIPERELDEARAKARGLLAVFDTPPTGAPGGR